jgi:hypothetical protein
LKEERSAVFIADFDNDGKLYLAVNSDRKPGVAVSSMGALSVSVFLQAR